MLELNEHTLLKKLSLSAPKQVALINTENGITCPGWKKSML
jgi:hypothetical protein